MRGKGFGGKGLTRKSHVLAIVMPRFLKKYKHFSIFYKAEEASEKLHHGMNLLSMQLGSIKPVQRMLLCLIKKYEEKNRADVSISIPVKRKRESTGTRASKKLKF